MDPIKDIVNQVVKSLTVLQPQQGQQVEQVWLQIVDKKTAQHTKLVGIKKGKLLVFVDSPARVFNLTIQKQSILSQLQHAFPDLVDVIFKIGKAP